MGGMSQAPQLDPNRVTRRTRITALIVATALFMQNIDSTMIATALPTMAREFGYDPGHMSVAMTSYLLSLAVFIPASGWIADRYGARNVFRWAIVIFTVGSILCAQAPTLVALVCARVVQGGGQRTAGGDGQPAAERERKANRHCGSHQTLLV